MNGRKIIQHGGGLPGFHSKVVLVPEENLGFVIIANQISGLVESVYKKILDDYIVHEGKDWADIYHKNEIKQGIRKKAADSLWQTKQQRGTKPSLALKKYTGTYEDTMYGTAAIDLQNKSLQLQLLPTKELLSGKLEHWQYDTFKIIMNDPFLPPGFVTFELNVEGEVEGFKIKLDNPDFHFHKLVFIKHDE